MAVPPVAESDPWFGTKGKLSEEEPATQEEVRALKDFLIGKTSASTAAKRLMTASEDEKPLQDKMNRVAWLVFDAAMHFQVQQTSILDLLEAIKNLSDDDFDLSIQQKEHYPTWSTWRNFERFVNLLDEMRRSYWARRNLPDEEDSDPHDCYHRWASLNAFFALGYVRLNEPLHLPAYGISVICEPLEQEPWKHSHSRTLADDEAKKYDMSIINAEIPAAVQWILIAGHQIHKAVDNESVSTRLKTSDLWSDDKPGLSRARWELWQTRLRWVEQQKTLYEETKALAQQALSKMAEIDANA